MLMLMRQNQTDLHYCHTLPYGPKPTENGVEFSLFSRHATSVRILLYDDVDDLEPRHSVEMMADQHRIGDIWKMHVDNVGPGQLYHFQADGPFDLKRGHRFDGKARLIDPYAMALAGDYLDASDGITRPPKCVVIDHDFQWDGDRHLKTSLADSIIYEMHVGGLTRHANSDCAYAGSYLGVMEKIPYLKSLGVTAVELLPIHEFPTNHHDGSSGATKNYWGYDTMNFFAPHRGYAFADQPGAQVVEFKQMVKALHQAGIEVILDVVYNHTCEGNEQGPVVSFKGLDNSIYYQLENDRQYYRNYSGCGNSVNCNHPVVRQMILDSLRHWVHNYHVDGFRFDLASILSRDQQGHLVFHPPLVEAIAEDPLLADIKIIAEAWDAAGAYQVGSFSNHPRWAEWNGRYRDDVRRYWRSDSHLRGAAAARLSGSSDVYQHSGRGPACSVNFITSHDGFTLNDLVSYNDKHNLANGEENRDGDNNNYSYNFGHEGETDSAEIQDKRSRQIRNYLATLLLSQGVPMLVAGDECRRTQQGNNNAYCQDNEISWFDWSLIETHADLVRFTRELIRFRKTQPSLRRTEYLTGESKDEQDWPDVAWFNANGEPINWHLDRSGLICRLSKMEPEIQDDVSADILMVMNPRAEKSEFVVPKKALAQPWNLFLDSAAATPGDIYPELNGPLLAKNGKLTLLSRSLRVYVSR